MERRAFVRNSAVLAGGILLQDTDVAALGQAKPVRIGIIGCGDRGKGLIQVLKQLPGKFQVTAICDVLDFRLTRARELCRPGVKSFLDYRELLADQAVEAVVIAVPLYLHYAMAVDTLKSDRHLYLEKTMTFTIEQALQLVELARLRPAQVVQIGHQYRYSPLYYKVRDMISKNYLGEITQIDCRWDRNNDWRRPVPDPSLERQLNWRMYREYSGGLIAELLSHQLDFVNWAFDTHPKEIFATGGIDFFRDGRETYDNVQVMVRYEGRHNMVGNFGATCSNSRDGYLFKIKGSLGTISLLTDQGKFYPEKRLLESKQVVDGVSGATRISWDSESGVPILPERTKDGTWYAFNDFHDCIQNKKMPDSNVVTGARTAISVHLANEALYSKKIMKWHDNYQL